MAIVDLIGEGHVASGSDMDSHQSRKEEFACVKLGTWSNFQQRKVMGE
jgi:hypothetical protein